MHQLAAVSGLTYVARWEEFANGEGAARHCCSLQDGALKSGGVSGVEMGSPLDSGHTRMADATMNGPILVFGCLQSTKLVLTKHNPHWL